MAVAEQGNVFLPRWFYKHVLIFLISKLWRETIDIIFPQDFYLLLQNNIGIGWQISRDIFGNDKRNRSMNWYSAAMYCDLL